MGRHRGNKLGFLIFDLYLKLGIRHAYALLYFVCIYYLIFDRQAYKVTVNYVKRRFPEAGLFARIWHVYKLMITTGKNLIDLRQLEKKPQEVKFESNNKPIMKILKQKKGLFLLTAHMGNWQVMMRKLPDFGLKINIVMRPEENPVVSEILKIDHAEPYDINLIDPTKGMEAVLEIMQELDMGNIVSIMGDRKIKDEKTIELNFFGKKITLPKGPFLIANSVQAPVIQLLANRQGPSSYSLETAQIIVDKSIKDKEKRICAFAEEYIKNIEDFLDRNPYEWNATSMN